MARHCHLTLHKEEKDKKKPAELQSHWVHTSRSLCKWLNHRDSGGGGGVHWANTETPGNIFWLVLTLTTGSLWDLVNCKMGVLWFPFQRCYGVKWEWLKQNTCTKTVGNKWMLLSLFTPLQILKQRTQGISPHWDSLDRLANTL